MKVYGVVVTYNRLSELKKNIDSIKMQTLKLDKLIIIDNCSTDGTEEFFLNYNDNSFIKYIRTEENLGGSYGFYLGMKTSYDDGADCVLLMDDDGRFSDSFAYENLIKKVYEIGSDTFMLNSLVTEDGVNLSFPMYTYYTVKEVVDNSKNNICINHINPFNGTLISRQLIKKIGYPNKDFFIRGDETDYEKRALKVGAYLGTVVNSFYYHPMVKREYFKFLCFKYLNDFEAPWKEYYMARNYTFCIGKKHKKTLIKRIIKNFMYHDKNWVSRRKMIIRGYKDGIKGVLGKTVLPGQIDFKYKERANNNG